MAQNELEEITFLPMINQGDIKVEVGEIQFPGFPSLRATIETLTEAMVSVEVNEENIQQSKKLVAKVRKETNFLQDEVKRVTKFYEKPLEDFKEDVKELTNLVKQAEEVIRSQVRDMEERERAEKEETISELFDKRSKQYNLHGILDFTDFWKREYANKSFSMNKVEEEMVTWLGKVEKDLNFLAEQGEKAYKYFAEYKDTKDVVVAMQIVKREEQYLAELQRKAEQVNSAIVTPVNEDYLKTKQEFKFVVTGENDAETLRQFMTMSGIKFREV